MEKYAIAFWKSIGYVFVFLLLFLVKAYWKLRNYFLKVCWLCFCVSVAVFSKIIWKTTKLLFDNFESLLLFLLLFVVKSYGKLRNCFLKVCWLCFYVSVAVFSKIIWKTTRLLFESMLLFLLLFLVKSHGKLRNCFLKVCWLWFLCFCCCFGCYFCFCCCSEAVSQYSRSASVLRKFLDACAAYFKEVFECSRSASGLMQILNARAVYVF